MVASPAPELALSWQALGPEVWELRLRPYVRFGNGEAFDATVVRRNLLAQRDDLRAASRTWLRSITDVEVMGAATVRTHTAGRVPDLRVEVRVVPDANERAAAGYPDGCTRSIVVLDGQAPRARAC